MAILDFFRGTKADESRAKSEIKSQFAPPVMDQPFGTYWGQSNFGGYNNYANAILRQDAMAVPTVSRCRSLIANTIASIPMEMYSLKTGEELPSLAWVDQPDVRQPRAVTIAWTVDSLLFYGVAYWRVTEVYADDNRPARFEWVQNDRVTVKYTKNNTEVDYYMIDGATRLPMSGVGSLITFQALDQGLLTKSGTTIRAALDVEKAAAISAQNPQPSGFIKNNGADLPDAQIQGILAAWKSARQNRATAYLTSTLDYQVTAFSPKDMMYNEAKAYYALELCRACNVSADMADAEQMKSQTYQNILDRRKEFAVYTLQPFYTAIEARLSMDDLSARGQVIRFSIDETFLRTDAMARLDVTEKLLTLGLIDIEQAKEMEDLTPEGSGEYDVN
ncbi:portal_HK97, phage portal protein, HK97 family [uncultured Caudovirales phage]|uniref:Portal_HK97, phage portal protein, HK97 family n=1 Tax=uncultured Caudovirales phage TaxID=2100421 RepID=A0A6J5RP79_9CAUD|nr:portal_HK97, phage portal protein, HK97 family [uncultured Caudovirales phage]CAB4194065.1 portal_HK97, phage portal protein, HK97 family [uncultured Caudovirales phage]CAB4216873.1 portal_HK97, phage portal protein, HK97 family [uncultured Caudovirales phage]